MADQRNPTIVCCRVASMMLIILCHIIGFYLFIPGHAFLGQILNVGVFSFLAISGYLYGSKTIDHFAIWFRKRYLAVVLPASIVIITILALECCAGNKPSAFSALIYLLNLQGLGFFIPGFYNYFSEITVLGPLWFITVIGLCYCMVPLLQKYRERFLVWKYSTTCVICAVPICFVLALVTGFTAVYFLTFAIGYYLSAKDAFKPVRMRHFSLFSVVMLVAQILRLVLQVVYDGTPVYQHYALISHMILGIWILYFFFAFSRLLPKTVNYLANHKIIAVGNDISFYVYLIHYCFCRGSLNVYHLVDNLLLATVVFLLASILSSLILKRITVLVQHALTAHS